MKTKGRTIVLTEEQAYNNLGLYLEDILHDMQGSRSDLDTWMLENGYYLEKGVVYKESVE